MGRQQEMVYHVKREEFPQDFPARLEVFVEAAGLSWRWAMHAREKEGRAEFTAWPSSRSAWRWPPVLGPLGQPRRGLVITR